MNQSELTSMLRTSAGRVEVGAVPGTLFHNPDAESSNAIAVAYGPQALECAEAPDIDSVRAWRGALPVVWVHVSGFADTALIRAVAAEFGLHDLVVADVVNVHQRAKVDEYEDHLFVVLRAPAPAPTLETQQIALVLGEGFLLTFAERESAFLEPVRARLANARGALRAKGADYLAYAVIDAVVDSFFPLMETYGEQLEAVETSTIEHPDRRTSRTIHALRADLLLLRRCAWPLREVVNELTRGTAGFVTEETRIYLRDCYDHAVHVLDTVETYRELAFGLVELHMSSLSSHMSEVMKVLTIIATVFIPLSFVTGLFGMNFDREFPWNQPELGWPFGYAFALGLMVAVAATMLLWFRRRGWIGSGGDGEGPPRSR
jgi:magnesium transporter